MKEVFSIKEKAPELRFATLAQEVWQALGELKRTGWVKRGVANPESVQEHTITLRNIAASLDSLTDEEKTGLLDMLEVHDWPEAIHGDEVVISTDAQELKTRKALKFEKEQKAIATICDKLGDKGQEIMNLWLRFETSSDPAAVFARQLDKYQAIEKALEYEKAQGISLFKEFLDYARPNITHPILVARLARLEEEFSNK